MAEILTREFIYLRYFFFIQVEQIFMYWALGVVTGSMLSVLGREKLYRMFAALNGKKLGALGVIPASLIGAASPLCMYGTVPIAAAFSGKGMKDDMLAAFMMSSILLNPQLIAYSAALGSFILAVRIATCLLCGMIAGLLVRYFYKGEGFFDFSGFKEPQNRDTDPNILMRLIKNIWRNIKATGPYFLIGVALSAAFTRYIPESVVAGMFGGEKAFGALMAATIGVPVYVCGGGTIPLLQGWLASGMSAGSAAAFMIAGPATKITNLGAVKIVLGLKRFLLYLLFSMFFAYAAGIAVDFLRRGWI
ncbi:MAG: permease [Oscillospiraceae bacterium]|nr:permease [Oscillospiraceae bacterium]